MILFGTPKWAIDLILSNNNLWRRVMALDAQVQRLVDAVTANTSAVKSATDALAIEATQIADLKAQLAAIVPGQPVDAEDLAAITKAADDLQATNTALQAAVPASVPPV